MAGGHSADCHRVRARTDLACALRCGTSTPPAQRLGDVVLRSQDRTPRSPRSRVAGHVRAWVTGISEGSPRWRRTFWTAGVWSIKAIRRRRPSQRAQARTSKPKVRLMRSARAGRVRAVDSHPACSRLPPRHHPDRWCPRFGVALPRRRRLARHDRRPPGRPGPEHSVVEREIDPRPGQETSRSATARSGTGRPRQDAGVGSARTAGPRAETWRATCQERERRIRGTSTRRGHGRRAFRQPRTPRRRQILRRGQTAAGVVMCEEKPVHQERYGSRVDPWVCSESHGHVGG